MSKKLLTIFSLLLIFFAMSCNNNSTDPTAPLKDSQYVGKWYEETSSELLFEIKQDGSIDIFSGTTVAATTVNASDVVKEGDATFKISFVLEGQSYEVSITFTSSTVGSMTLQGQGTAQVVKK